MHNTGVCIYINVCVNSYCRFYTYIYNVRSLPDLWGGTSWGGLLFYPPKRSFSIASHLSFGAEDRNQWRSSRENSYGRQTPLLQKRTRKKAGESKQKKSKNESLHLKNGCKGHFECFWFFFFLFHPSFATSISSAFLRLVYIDAVKGLRAPGPRSCTIWCFSVIWGNAPIHM